jgi:hypothetical protein
MKAPRIVHGTIIKHSANDFITVRLDRTGNQTSSSSTFISVSCHSLTLPANTVLPLSALDTNSTALECSVALGPFCFTTFAFINCTLVCPPMPDWSILVGDTFPVAAGEAGKRKPGGGASKSYGGGYLSRVPYAPPDKNSMAKVASTPATPYVPERNFYSNRKKSKPST